MPTLEIDGVGRIEVDNSFASMSPEAQNDFVSGIVRDVGNGMRSSDGDTVSKTESGIRGAAQGATMGFGDEMAGSAAASPLPGSQAATKTTLGGMGAPDVIAGMIARLTGRGQDAYTKERDRVRSGNDAAAAANPISFGAGQLAGAIVGGAPIAAGAGAAMRGAPLLTRAAISAATGAPMGAIQGAGEAKDMASLPKDAAIGAGVGGGLGFVLPAIGSGFSRLISPMRISADRQPLVDALRREGVELTAGQATGSKPLQYLESALGDLPGSGRGAADFMERQGQQFTQAALKRMGATGNLATPDVIDPAVANLGQKFEQLSARNTLKFDHKFAQDIGRTMNEYDRVLPSQQKPIVDAYLQDLYSQPGGMPGAMYQETRSRLSRQSKALQNSDPALSGVLKGFQKALDGAMDRSIVPADQGAWQEARGQWKNWKAIEKAITGAGEKTAQGYISPSQLRNAVASQGRPQYARGQGDLAELARAGEGVMKPLPNSGTAPRTNINQLLSAFGAAGGYGVGNLPGAIAGAMAPAVIGRTLMSGPVQRYLTNQAAAIPASAQSAMLQQLLLAAPAREALVSRYAGR